MKKVEFIGLSGSGKSTAMKILEEYLQSHDTNVTKVNDILNIPTHKKILPLISFTLKNFSLTCFTIKEVFKRRDKIFILKRFFQIFYCHQYLLPDKNFTLFDESFICLGFYLHDNFPKQIIFNEKKLEKYINKIPKPDYLMYVKTSPQTAINRMRDRGIIHSLDGHSDEQINNFYLHSLAYFEKSSKELKKRGVKVITVSNDGNYSNLEHDLHRIFKEIKLR